MKRSLSIALYALGVLVRTWVYCVAGFGVWVASIMLSSAVFNIPEDMSNTGESSTIELCYLSFAVVVVALIVIDKFFRNRMWHFRSSCIFLFELIYFGVIMVEVSYNMDSDISVFSLFVQKMNEILNLSMSGIFDAVVGIFACLILFGIFMVVFAASGFIVEWIRSVLYKHCAWLHQTLPQKQN